MKLDKELIREILECIEEENDGIERMKKYNSSKVYYHLELLSEEKYTSEIIKDWNGFNLPRDLTMKGHLFLEELRTKKEINLSSQSKLD